MADADLALLRRLGSAEAWNRWREQHPNIQVDLQGQNLYGLFAELGGAPFAVKGARARLRGINLRAANVRSAFLEFADLGSADLREADLEGAILTDAILDESNIESANLRDANLRRASLRNAKLRDSNLMYAQFNGANLSGTDLDGANIYGTSAWNVSVDDRTSQRALRVANYGEPAITVDDLEVAQFVYLLVNRQKVRQVIDTLTSKVVLILGRFTEERKAVLDAMRDALRRRGLIPILFDFDRPASKDLTGTVETLARMARFIVADLTDPSSVPHELATVVPFLRTTPVVLLRLEGSGGYSMIEDLAVAYDRWVIPVADYANPEALIRGIDDYVVSPANARLAELRPEDEG
jgi:uncharacterized protein YjbI with pentapeptide repeats